jgi:hypothetical protein
MRDPPDLQTAMYYAQAFERRAAAMQSLPPARGARPPPRPALPPQARAPIVPQALGGQGAAAANAAPAARPFCCLSPAEHVERRRQGLCYNCDEPYVPGHVCQQLFYIEVDDYVANDVGRAGTTQWLPRPRRSRLPTSRRTLTPSSSLSMVWQVFGRRTPAPPSDGEGRTPAGPA